ncbi:MAG: recombinase family protein [Alphaproteobacteria bacterium]|jgi:site-specific DNA recombinase|nr:recombinase family protein [Pseudomonadota bacterium]MBT5494144.1 recombinase family protein [Alphaproteobacteria bacterium]
MSQPVIRCAIYTRKSSDEGLDQSFNSLDAQYESCASYIASQRHEGWKLFKGRYDDGGVSGGTLERPALKRLLDDIEAGRVQMVVVYKIDRLTRSLADFAKLVERLDAASCSFVSVTQAFNTSSSMGRLTLNVLLSFAQFEREVTAERIRDKIAASKQKGLWMGGVCPLGYDKHPDPQARTLVVNDGEAKTVTELFQLYDQLCCLRAVEHEVARKGLRSKHHIYSTGRVAGGRPFSRGQIYYVLRNPLYIGQIRHKEMTYPGQHPAIVSLELWERVQRKLMQASRSKRGLSKSQNPSSFLLTGKLIDDAGDRLTPTSTVKGNRKHRYYVSSRLTSGTKDISGWRLPASKLEEKIITLVAEHLAEHARRMTLCPDLPLHQMANLRDEVATFAAALKNLAGTELRDVIANVRLGDKQVEVHLNAAELAERLHIEVGELNPEITAIQVPWQIKRRGVETKIIIGDELAPPDSTLIKRLDQAHTWIGEMRRSVPLKMIADQAGVSPAYIRTRSKLAFLSPKIQRAILDGALDPKFTVNLIIGMAIPLKWDAQETLFLKT